MAGLAVAWLIHAIRWEPSLKSMYAHIILTTIDESWDDNYPYDTNYQPRDKNEARLFKQPQQQELQ
jgi:hypothetical protein